MAANLILPFAQGGGANIQTQADYNADSQRALGNQPGVARAAFVNKAMRQASVLAAGLAQWIADNQVSDVDDTLLATALSTMISNAAKSVASPPSGSIIWLPGTTAPSGTLKVNGTLLSRASYPKLWTFAQNSGNIAASDGAWASGQFSPGDGATTFRIPDLRGYFLRAWDDGRGINTSRVIGSVEADQNASHTHTINDPGHAHTVNDPTHNHTVYAGLGTGSQGIPVADADGNQLNYAQTSTASATGITIAVNTTGITIVAQGGAEVRVKNIALMPVIYF